MSKKRFAYVDLLSYVCRNLKHYDRTLFKSNTERHLEQNTPNNSKSISVFTWDTSHIWLAVRCF